MTAVRRWQRGLLGLFLVQLLIGRVERSAHAADAPQAPNASESLLAAERAFQNVDFAATYDNACGALERGHADVQQSARLHVLCGISAAALEKSDEARTHFTVALAMRQDLRLERDLSPRIRGPYLEAQGAWAGTPERLSIKAANNDDQSRLHFKIADPSHLGFKLKAFLRAVGESRFRAIAVEPRASLSIPLPPELMRRGYDYYAVLLDARDNALVEFGTEADPFVVRPVQKPTALGGMVKRPAETHLADSATETQRSHWLPVTLLATGVAAAGAGVYFNVKREDAAAKWNGPGCEQPGITRIDQCANINGDRVHAERAAIGLYAAGGVLVAAGLTLWALEGPERTPPWHATTRPKRFIACAAALPMAGLACSGQF